jgi:hypothetical protein
VPRARTYEQSIKDVLDILNWQAVPDKESGEDQIDPVKDRHLYVRRTKAFALKRLKQKVISRDVYNEVLYCLEDPDHIKVLWKRFHDFKAKKAQHEFSINKLADLKGQRAYVVSQKFLKRWHDENLETKIPGAGTIPGFAGFGADLIREVLRILPEVNQGKRPMAHVDSASLSRKTGVPDPDPQLVPPVNPVLD